MQYRINLNAQANKEQEQSQKPPSPGPRLRMYNNAQQKSRRELRHLEDELAVLKLELHELRRRLPHAIISSHRKNRLQKDTAAEDVQSLFDEIIAQVVSIVTVTALTKIKLIEFTDAVLSRPKVSSSSVRSLTKDIL